MPPCQPSESPRLHRRRFCCTNHMKDSRHESSVIAGRYEQLGPAKYRTTNWSSYNDICGWLLHCKRFVVVSAFIFVSTVVCPASHDDFSVNRLFSILVPEANSLSADACLQTSHPAGTWSQPLSRFRDWRAPKERHHSVKTAFIVPRRTTATFPRSPGGYALAEQPDLVDLYAAGFIVTPCGTTPSVTNRQRAISSFRASATIITFRMRRPVWPVLSRNQVTCAAPGW